MDIFVSFFGVFVPLRIRRARVLPTAQCPEEHSRGSVALLFQLGQGFTHETVGKRLGGGIPGAAMLAVHIDQAQRAPLLPGLLGRPLFCVLLLTHTGAGGRAPGLRPLFSQG